MADDIQNSFKELVANAVKEKPSDKWMLFVAMGFIAGAIAAYLVTSNLSVQEQVEDVCGTCVHNYNILAHNCGQIVPIKSPMVKNISILPGVIDEKVVVYAS